MHVNILTSLLFLKRKPEEVIKAEDLGCPDIERNATIETTATDTGEAQTPICDATDETAIGRSGQIPCLIAIS